MDLWKERLGWLVAGVAAGWVLGGAIYAGCVQ